jgi:hypothetical protein
VRSRFQRKSPAGASPITDAICPRSSVRSERHRAKVEAAGAIPALDAILPLCLSSNRASFVNSYSSVRVRPGAPSGLWCNSSISPCEGDGPGANPGFLTNNENARRTLKGDRRFRKRNTPQGAIHAPAQGSQSRYLDTSCSSRDHDSTARRTILASSFYSQFESASSRSTIRRTGSCKAWEAHSSTGFHFFGHKC